MLKRARKRRASGQDPKERFSIDEVAEALRKSDGLITIAAKRLRLSYPAIVGYMERHPQLEDIRDAAREEMLDLAESKLKSKVKSGNLDATKFTLKTIGKRRGFVERSELAGVVDQPLSINIVPAPGVTKE